MGMLGVGEGVVVELPEPPAPGPPPILVPEPGAVGLLSLHPTIRAMGIKAIINKPPISFFTFIS
jgi:hypothetical protein